MENYLCPRCNKEEVTNNMTICKKCIAELVLEDKKIQGEI